MQEHLARSIWFASTTPRPVPRWICLEKKKQERRKKKNPPPRRLRHFSPRQRCIGTYLLGHSSTPRRMGTGRIEATLDLAKPWTATAQQNMKSTLHREREGWNVAVIGRFARVPPPQPLRGGATTHELG